MRRLALASLTAALAVSAFAAAPSGTRASETEWKYMGEGTFADPLLCNIYSGTYPDPVKVRVEQSVTDPAVYRIVEPWNAFFESHTDNTVIPEHHYMIIDASDPDFVLVRENRIPFEDPDYGEVLYKSMSQFSVDFFADNGKSYEEAREMFMTNMSYFNITMKEGMIKFPGNCFGIKYPAIPAPDGKTGWEPMVGEMAYEGYLLLPNGTMEDDWTSLGTGKMLEGFVWTVFDADPKEKEVEVFENNKVKGVYKIPAAFTDSYEKANPLIIDARDPGWVRIDKMDTRIKTQDYGNLWILSVSANGFEDYDGMVGFDPINEERNITLKDKYIDIPAQSVYLQFPEYNNWSVMSNDLAVDSYIKLPGYVESSVEDIFVTEDGVTEYYDLQGMRIAEPAAGQIVIVRKGDKVSKEIMR